MAFRFKRKLIFKKHATTGRYFYKFMLFKWFEAIQSEMPETLTQKEFVRVT